MFSREISLTAGFRNNVGRHSPVTPLLEGNDLLSRVVQFVTACDGRDRTPPAAKTEAE